MRDGMLIVNGRLHRINGAPWIAESTVEPAHVPVPYRFGLAVTNVTDDGHALFIEFDGTGQLAYGGVSVAQVSKRKAFSPTITNFAADDEILAVEVDRVQRFVQQHIATPYAI